MGQVGIKEKKDIIKPFMRHDKDTGSSEVQITLLTERINHLVEHLKKHKKDHHTRRGLLTLVSRRRKFLKYLRRKDTESFSSVTKKLKIKTK